VKHQLVKHGYHLGGLSGQVARWKLVLPEIGQPQRPQRAGVAFCRCGQVLHAAARAARTAFGAIATACRRRCGRNEKATGYASS
jgi:hypothetical protein